MDISFLYFGSGAVGSLLRHLALLSAHDLAVPDMLILYHTFMNLGRVRSALEGRLRPLIGTVQAFIEQYYLRPNTAAACRSVQRSDTGSHLVNTLVVWASPGVAYGILPIWPLVRS